MDDFDDVNQWELNQLTEDERADADAEADALRAIEETDREDRPEL